MLLAQQLRCVLYEGGGGSKNGTVCNVDSTEVIPLGTCRSAHLLPRGSKLQCVPCYALLILLFVLLFVLFFILLFSPLLLLPSILSLWHLQTFLQQSISRSTVTAGHRSQPAKPFTKMMKYCKELLGKWLGEFLVCMLGWHAEIVCTKLLGIWLGKLISL